MSQFYDQASLVMVPSGYKDGKLYSQKPLSTSGELSFSRGSDIEATRVGSDGLIHKAKVNLLLQSNAFSTTWLNQLGGTITGGQSGYDGTNDAWLLSKDTSTFRSIRQVISFTGVVTYSAYVKVGTLSNVALRIDSSAGALQAKYDLSTGTTDGIGGSYIEYGIDSIGSGWYRIFVTANISGGTNVHVYVDRDGTTAGNIYIQDAQVNYGLVAQTYVETTTAAVVSGITNDMPRLNYDPANPTCPSLLLEPSATAINQDSENFSGLYWTKGDLTVEQNTSETLDPSGNYSASKLTETATTARHRLLSGAVTMAAVSNTSSVFLKKGTARYGFVTMSGAATSTIVVDLEDGTITDTSTSGTIVAQKVEDYGSGWYRISVTALGISAATSANLQFGSAGSATPSYTANIPSFAGSTSNYLYAWGANLTNTGYLQSYIPTYGSSATRTADAVSDSTFTALPNANFTIFFEVNEWSGSEGNNYQLRFFDASGSRAIQFRNRPEGWRWLIVNDAGGSAYLNSPSYTFTKMACRYDGTNYQLFADGSAFGVPFAASDTGILDYFDSYPIGVMGIKQMLCFPTALSDADCITLTSL